MQTFKTSLWLCEKGRIKWEPRGEEAYGRLRSDPGKDKTESSSVAGGDGKEGTGEGGEVENSNKTSPPLVISCGQNTHEWFWQK